MAILPAKNSGKAKQHASGARFRQRKISVKQPLTIYKQKDLPAYDVNNNELEPSQVNHLSATGSQQQRDLHSIETGVDKNEEDEVHLQQVINAAQRALLGSKSDENPKHTKKDSSNSDSVTGNNGNNSSNNESGISSSVYIPTPDASKLWPEAHKYYNDQSFQEPESYIKFSATVEDTIGVEYNMDEDDEVYLNDVLRKEYPKPPATNKKSKNNEENLRKCSELEFEIICDKLEKTIEERQPFLSMDPTNILSYEELSSYIIDEYNNSTKLNNPYVQSSGGNIKYISTTVLKERLSKEINYDPYITIFDKDNNSSKSHTPPARSISKLFELFGSPIYDHWKARKIERKGKSIHPILKFEDPSANEKDNDNDPYICFRRREFRQARKTRRADTLGAERIRLLQKSLHQARSLILGVAQREILKFQNFEIENTIFKLRSEGKNLKRVVGVKGDDYLYYPHKRKKVVKPKEEDEETKEAKAKKIERKKIDSRESSAAAMPGTATIGTNAVIKDKNGHVQQPSQPEAASSSSTQPYVKLPPSKIPDMELVTVSLVLKEKNETIKRAVLEKLRKRKEQDKGYVNFTDDPQEPSFNISTHQNVKELSHIPYSSIAAANLHQINTSNYISENLKKLIEEGKKPLPGIKTFRGSNGELIPSKAFPHISSLLQDKINKSKLNSISYIAQLLNNIEANNFSAYNSGYAHQFKKQNPHEFEEESKFSEPIFRLRKRVNRVGQTFVDRRGLIQRPDDEIDSFLKFSDDEEEEDNSKDGESNNSFTDKGSKVLNVYDSKVDTITRLDSNWKFDSDLSEVQRGVLDPFSMDPSKLNSISDDTQSIRFGSMLLSKSYGLLRESVQQRQQAYIQQAKMRALQQQQLASRLQQQQQQQQIQQQQQMQQFQQQQLQQQQLQQQQQFQNQQQPQQQQLVQQGPAGSVKVPTPGSNVSRNVSTPGSVKKRSVSQTSRSNGEVSNSQKSSLSGSPKAPQKVLNSPQ